MSFGEVFDLFNSEKTTSYVLDKMCSVFYLLSLFVADNGTDCDNM